MRSESQKLFDAAAEKWDENPARVELGRKAAEAIIAAVEPSPELDALDIGCGAGLVTLPLSPHFRSILAVDTSGGMLEVLARRVVELGITNVTPRQMDLAHDELIEARVDVIFSSMTLHHVPDPGRLILRASGLLRSGGKLCVMDLDEEDGSFHGGEMSVEHYGFSAERMHAMFADAGLERISSRVVHEMERRREQDGAVRAYPILMTLGEKP